MNPEIVVTGNLGDDPELRYSPAGNPFTRCRSPTPTVTRMVMGSGRTETPSGGT